MGYKNCTKTKVENCEGNYFDIFETLWYAVIVYIYYLKKEWTWFLSELADSMTSTKTLKNRNVFHAQFLRFKKGKWFEVKIHIYEEKPTYY